MTREVLARGGVPAGGEAASLVESAMLLRWRAPELALLLADRAVSAAQDDRVSAQRAEHLAVFTLNRLGRHAEAAQRLFPAIHDAAIHDPAIHDAGTPAGLRHELHVELAQCAAALDEPAIALNAVHPVLAAGDDVAPALRGGALIALAEASAALGSDELVASVLEEADELYREDPGLDHDTALLLRAGVRARDAARYRARGAADEAEAKAREGHELLADLADPDYDSGEVSARLMHELALLLLDRGAGEAAMTEARPLLRRPVRAVSAAAGGRLRLVLATRVHLAEGRHEPALTLLADAVEGAQRYGMDAVLAECLEGLSHVHEARDEFADALHCVRAARAAEGRHLREVADARSALRKHCGSARRDEERLVRQVFAWLSTVELPAAADVAEVAVTEVAVTEVAVAEVAVTEVAVTDVAGEETTLTPAAAIDQAGEPAMALLDVEASNDVESCDVGAWQSRARHRREEAEALVSVSDLVPESVLSAGRSGRRHAEELAPGDQVDETAPAEILEGSPSREQEPDAPPPAPAPPTLNWTLDDQAPAAEADTRQMGLGDLLAEALAAYQEGHDGDTARESDSSEASYGASFEPITSPILRLPDLTAEPQWAPSEVECRPAAGG